MILSKIIPPAIGVTAALISAPKIEKLMPVVAFMESEIVSYNSNGDFTTRVQGRKIRDCVFVKGSYAGWYMVEGKWYEAERFSFPDDPDENSRPAGTFTQDFGLWRWHNLPYGAEQVRFTVVHDCSGELKLTTVGPFDVESDENG